MLEFILELTSNIISQTYTLSEIDKETVNDEVSYALNQTRLHILNTRRDGLDKASSQLSNIWRRVGNRLRQIHDQDIENLATTIEQKSIYWSDPINYDVKNLEYFEMRLTQVEQKLNQIKQ